MLNPVNNRRIKMGRAKTPNTGQLGEVWKGDDAVLALQGRINIAEFLLVQLMHQGLKDAASKKALALSMQKLEQELHGQIPLLDGDGKRVRQHALEALKQIISTLTVSLSDKG
jgi:hypothetical protein